MPSRKTPLCKDTETIGLLTQFLLDVRHSKEAPSASKVVHILEEQGYLTAEIVRGK